MEDSEDWTIPCPHCGEEIYEDAPQCPHCQTYLSPEDFRRPRPWWLVVVILLTLAGLLLATL